MGQGRPQHFCHGMLVLSGPGGRINSDSPAMLLRFEAATRGSWGGGGSDKDNNKGVEGGRQVSSLKMPPGVLLF